MRLRHLPYVFAIAFIGTIGLVAYNQFKDDIVIEDDTPKELKVGMCEAVSPRKASGPGFRDCEGAWCPAMVPIPPGSFCMGSPADEAGRTKHEGPVRKVTISQPFAVSKFEVTWDEWKVCVQYGGCDGKVLHTPGGDNGWGRGNRPVINVSYKDAQDYVNWLRRRTGKPYRLLSEAEWEYVARAGSATRFWWGDADPTCKPGARSGAAFDACETEGTFPVGSFRANRFGIYDMTGNVWEWVRDCWHDNYVGGAPADGSAWTTNCLYEDRFVTRGGSWSYVPGGLRSASRTSVPATLSHNMLGFRIARDM